jgi:hypothetical protein
MRADGFRRSRRVEVCIQRIRPERLLIIRHRDILKRQHAPGVDPLISAGQELDDELAAVQPAGPTAAAPVIRPAPTGEVGEREIAAAGGDIAVEVGPSQRGEDPASRRIIEGQVDALAPGDVGRRGLHLIARGRLAPTIFAMFDQRGPAGADEPAGVLALREPEPLGGGLQLRTVNAQIVAIGRDQLDAAGGEVILEQGAGRLDPGAVADAHRVADQVQPRFPGRAQALIRVRDRIHREPAGAGDDGVIIARRGSEGERR